MEPIGELILDTIGNTPLVRINRLNPNPNVAIYAKLEGFNPLGSVKERIALSMIEGAEHDGLLNKDKVIVESSSGNTGIGLAMVGAVKGYKVLITMSERASVERSRTPSRGRTRGASVACRADARAATASWWVSACSAAASVSAYALRVARSCRVGRPGRARSTVPRASARSHRCSS